MSLDDKINAAKNAQEKNPPHKDVTVTLDATLLEERNAILAELSRLDVQREAIIAEASQSLALNPDTAGVDKQVASAERKLKKLDAQEKDTLVTIRVYRYRGDEWFVIKSLNPPRVNSAMDRAVGYDVATLTKQAVETKGVIVDGGTESQPTETQWADLWPLLAGAGFEALADAVYVLNSAEPLERVERLKNS